MKKDKFLADVRELGEFSDNRTAEQATYAVLALLGQRLGVDEAENLAAQLPADLGDWLTEEAGPAQSWGRREFVRHVADALNDTENTALWDASAVLTTVAQGVSGGELNHVLNRLPSSYAELFGKPELT